jgi:hypothetical protein
MDEALAPVSFGRDLMRRDSLNKAPGAILEFQFPE